MIALADHSLAESVALLPEPQRRALLATLTAPELEALDHDWPFWARPKQLPPPGDWLTWLLQTGRGFGKSRSGGAWVHSRAMGEAGRWCALVAKTPADARDVMIEGPAGLLKNAPPHERPIYETSKRRVTWPNGSWGTIYSSEEPDQLRGFSGDTAWLDEFGKYANPREVWDNLQFGMREVSSDQPRICITTTPRPLPILEEIEEKRTTVTVRGSSYENRANLAPSWFDETLAAYEGTRLGRQEIYGERLDDVEGRVYSSFSKLAFPLGNVDASVIDTGAEILVGQDFNVNPMASVIAVRVADECHVLDALEVPVSNTEQVADEIRRRYPKRRIIVCPDPAGKQRHTNAPVGQTDFTILKRAGFEVRAPNAAPVVVDRVNNTQAMLLKGPRRRVRIHPRAKPLITALSNLTYKEGTNIRDKASGFDHICFAAGTPVLTATGWRRIESIRAGDLVRTRAGFFPVSHAGMTQHDAEVWDVDISTGARLTVTPDHPFFIVGKGFTPLRYVTQSDILFAWHEANPSSTEASRSDAIPLRISGRIASTSRRGRLIASQAWSVCTERFGRMRTGRFLTVITSTIATTTRSITRSTIWNAFLGLSTSERTLSPANGYAMVGLPSSSTPFAISPLSGTHPMRGESGTASTRAPAGQSVPSSRFRAHDVVPSSASSSQIAAQHTAPSGANPPHAESQASMTRTAPVPCAASCSASIGIVPPAPVRGHAVRISGTKRAHNASVYNLRVAGPHEYFAGGVLVSNCDALDYLLWQEFNVLAVQPQVSVSSWG